MKSLFLVSLILSCIAPSQELNFKPSVRPEDVFNLTASQLFNYSGESRAVREKKIYFTKGTGYFIHYETDNGNSLGSLLFEPKKGFYKIAGMYSGDLIPFDKNESYFISPFEFSATKVITESNLNPCSDFSPGVTYGYTIPSKFYFDLKDNSGSVSYLQSIYSASYMSEVKIKDVPNYMNTQFNNMGCAPTSTAMYLAFLEDRGYDSIVDQKYRNLPLKHTDDRKKLDNFIKFLGENYFNTTISSGTTIANIPSYLNRYFRLNGYTLYQAVATKNYNEYCNAIYNAANPVQMTIYNESYETFHDVIGVGYRQINNSDGSVARYIISNYAKNNSMGEVAFEVDRILYFYTIHRYNVC